MLSQIYYLIRSRQDGRHLVAHPHPPTPTSPDHPPPAQNSAFLLLFTDHADALSYLNTHGRDLAHQFAVESATGTQLSGLMQRWGFAGVGMVRDPLLPRIEFMQKESPLDRL
ncbi:MAG: hypothetical protein VKK04_09785 [Synechococcales bacterium]|nr:hypothetical protein [Synechococcales bacterium]